MLSCLLIILQSNEKDVRAQRGGDTDERKQPKNAGTQNINIDPGAYIVYVYVCVCVRVCTYFTSACCSVPP